MTDSSEKFASWAVVEMMGHQRIAGMVSEQTLGGCAMIRVDVPETQKAAYTKYLGSAAIYAITPCSEEVAKLAASQIEMYRHPIPVALPKALPAGVPTYPDGNDADDDDRHDWGNEDEGDNDA